MKCHFGSPPWNMLLLGCACCYTAWCMSIVTLLKWVIHPQQNDTFILLAQYTILFPINQKHPLVKTFWQEFIMHYHIIHMGGRTSTRADCVSGCVLEYNVKSQNHFSLSLRVWVTFQHSTGIDKEKRFFIFLINSSTRSIRTLHHHHHHRPILVPNIWSPKNT